MSFEKRFDEMIEFIEKNVKNDTTTIMESIKGTFSFWSPDVIAHAFEYITDMRLREYVARRRLIHTKKYKVETGCSIEMAAEEYGYSSETNFMKEFKKTFGTTVKMMPEEVYEEEKEPMRLEKILQNRVPSVGTKKVFDLPETQFERLRAAIALTEFYDMKKEDAEIAYQLTKDLEFGIEDIFAFCSDFFEHSYEVANRHPDVEVKNLAFLCLKLDKCVREGLEISRKMEADRLIEDYRTLPQEFWRTIADDTCPIDFELCPDLLLDVLDEMKSEGVSLSELGEVIDLLSWGWEITEAIEKIKDPDWFEDGDEDIEEAMQEEACWASVEATYTDDFLGISPSKKQRHKNDDDDEAVIF